MSPSLFHAQHFLTSHRTIQGLLDKTSLSPNDHVLEIGPGKGHITRQLLQRCDRVTAVEIDRRLCQRLQERFDASQHFKLVHGDFMQYKLPSKPYKVFANIPYSMTSDIIRKLTQAQNSPEDCYLIMERGAAKRFLGKPCDTKASLLLRPFYNLSMLATIPREQFHPMPHVESALLRIAKKTTADIPRAQFPAFEHFLQYAQLTPHQIRTALQRNGLATPSATLSYVQWLCLFRTYARPSKRGTRVKR